MIIENAKYKEIMGNKVAIIADIDEVETSVPLDPDNIQYAEILRLVDEGELTIADAE